jgi:hypothetical protein
MELIMAEVTVSGKHPVIGIIVAVGLIVACAYGVWRMRNQPKLEAAMERRLFAPYFQALQERRFDDAWQKYTTDFYKSRTPLEQYKAIWTERVEQQGSIAERGPPWFISMANHSVHAVETIDFGEHLLFEKNFSVTVLFSIVSGDDGVYRIDFTYEKSGEELNRGIY